MMIRGPHLRIAFVFGTILLVPGVARAAPDPARKASSARTTLLPGAGSKDPVSIDAARLDYFDKDQKLVYSGDVVAKQGESTLRATVLTIFLTRDAKKDGATPPPEAGSSVNRMEAKGPVTIVSKDQIGTGDSGVYDKAANRITLTGNVTLSQATNTIKGDKLVYDMDTGQAQVSGGQTQGRVRSVFTPGSGMPGTAPGSRKPGRATPAQVDVKPAAGVTP